MKEQTQTLEYILDTEFQALFEQFESSKFLTVIKNI